MSDDVLTIADLTLAFGSARPPAVDGVSLTLRSRRTLAVVGESGSGKSLTALAAIGLLPPGARLVRGQVSLAPATPDAAPLRLDTLTPRAWRRVRGSQIAMVFQEPMTALNPVRTIGEHLVEVLRLHRGGTARDARRAATDALAEVGIADAPRRLGQYPHEFSGGMRQRVMIALALAGSPRVLLADEPTTAIDATLRGQVLDLLARLKDERGLAVMLITHDLALAAKRAEAVCVMHRGRVVESGAASDVLAHPRHDYTRGLLRCVPGIDTRGRRLATIGD